MTVIDLSTLDGADGFRLDGIDTGDQSGVLVSDAGDVNGDGFADLIVGAHLASPNGDFRAGGSYVVFGKASGFSAGLDLGALDGTDGFRLDGIDPADTSGRAVSAAGDVNGDGFADVIIGAFAASPNGQGSAGESYVVFGKAAGFTAGLDLSAVDGADGFRLDGVDASENSGRSVSDAGYVNGYGFGDLIIGAPGAATYTGESYVVFGKATGFTAGLALADLDGSDGFRLDGIDTYDYSGFSVSGAGDINGDGFADLVVGAYYAGSNGESYVVFGKDAGFTADVDLSGLDGSDGFRLDGAAADDKSGQSVSGAGDVNGDGFADLIIGAYSADPNGDSQAGESYVVFGKASGFTTDLDLSALDGVDGFRLEP